MLKLTVLGLMATILTVGTIFAIFFAIFDLMKDFIVIFMMLWYVLK